jgi:hypothetical protein
LKVPTETPQKQGRLLSDFLTLLTREDYFTLEISIGDLIIITIIIGGLNGFIIDEIDEEYKDESFLFY